MTEIYSLLDGPFGRVEVVEYRHNLIVHSHSQTHLGFWLSGGAAHAHIGTQRINYEPHVAVGINSLVSHKLCLDDVEKPAIFLMLYINNSWLDTCLLHLGGPVVFPQAKITITAPIQDACWNLLKNLELPLTNDTLLAEKSVLDLFQKTIGNLYEERSASAIPVRRKMLDYRLRKAMDHMRNNMSKPSVAEEVAEVVGLSRSRFFELFYDELKTSPIVYWNALRFEEAVKRLKSNQENMTSVAMELGFSSPGNFSRFFREHMGMTPSTFRRISHAI